VLRVVFVMRQLDNDVGGADVCSVFSLCCFFMLTVLLTFANVGWWLADGRQGVDKRERSFSGEFHSAAVDKRLTSFAPCWYATCWLVDWLDAFCSLFWSKLSV